MRTDHSAQYGLTTRTRCASGFTLIELMIGMTIGLIVLLGLSFFFSYNSRNQHDLDRSIVRLENARFALSTLTEDLLHAGYYARHVPGDSLHFNAIVPCPASTAHLGWNAAATDMPPAVAGLTADPANTAQKCLTGLRAGTNVITVTHAATGASIAPDNTVATNLYIQTAGCTADLTRVTINTGPASNFTLRNTTCSATNNVQRLSQRTYFLSTCSDCTGKDGIPSLKRGELIGDRFLVNTVAEGIEQLQFEYGVDIDNNGQVDEMLSHTSITGVAPYEWRNVVSVRIHMLTRSTLPDPGHIEQRTFLMGPLTLTPADLPSGFKRTLLSTTVPLINVVGRRE